MQIPGVVLQLQAQYKILQLLMININMLFIWGGVALGVGVCVHGFPFFFLAAVV